MAAEELVTRGHDLTLFATETPNTSLWDRALRLDGSVKDPKRFG